MKILIIDDDPEFSGLLKHYVSAHWGDAAVEMADPRDAIPGTDAIRDGGYDAVLLDHRLNAPGTRTSGLDLLREYQGLDDFPPVIMITGEDIDRLSIDAIRAGAADYIPKRLTRDMLIKALSHCTGRRIPQPQMPTLRAPAEKQGGLSLIGGYRLEERIGHGCTGYVYRARSETDATVAALKLIPLTGEDQRRERLRRHVGREIEAVAASDSRYIPRFHGHGEYRDFLYIAMEWLDGGTLKDRIDEIAVAGAWQAIPVVIEIASGLRELHAAGIFHCDIKPQNIMFRSDDSMVLIDFGIADLADDTSVLGENRAAGSPFYMSPEQFMAGGVAATTDLYALGVLMYELLTGVPPYFARSVKGMYFKHRHAPIPTLPSHLERFQPTLERLMAKEPADRFQTADEAIASLRPLVDAE